MVLHMMKADWYSMKYYWVRAIFVIILFVIFGLVMPFVVPFMAVLLASAYATNPFAMEEKGYLDGLYMTFPVNRRAVVQGRFLLQLVFLGVAIAFSAFCSLALGSIFDIVMPLDVTGFGILTGVSILVFGVMNIATFPLLFKLGYSKAKFWGFMLPIIVIFGAIGGIVGGTVGNYGPQGAIIHTMSFLARLFGGQIVWVPVLAALIGAVLVLISYLLSLHIYKRRDL